MSSPTELIRSRLLSIDALQRRQCFGLDETRTMKIKEQLIYIASNSKGDHLFDVMRLRYKHGVYIDSSYRSVKRLKRVLKMLSSFKSSLISLRKSVENPEIDFWFKKQIEKQTIRRIKKHYRPGSLGENDVLLWFPLFPITSGWRKYGRLSVVTDVAMDEVYFENFNIPPGKAREIRKKNWDINFETCDHIFTLSKWAMEANKKLHPDKTEKLKTIGWGPNILLPSLDEILNRPRQNRVLCVGHDYYKKGVDIFNEVSRRLKGRIPSLECVIIGRAENGVDPSKLESLTILPPATPEQVSSMMKSSKIFMILSRFDAAGHVTVEAMSQGLPVICSNVCGMPEAVLHGKTGYVVDTANIEDIVNKAYDLLTNNKKLDAFRRAAYEHAAEHWQWKHVADRIINAYFTSVAANPLPELLSNRGF